MRRHPRRYVEVRSLSDTLTLIATGAIAGVAAGVVLGRRYQDTEALIDDVRARLRSALEFWTEDDDSLLEEETTETEDADELDLELDVAAVTTLSDAEAAPEPGRALPDDRAAAVRELETRVLGRFEQDDVLHRRAVDIAAVGSGVIELTGWVHSGDEASRAAALARSVPGVDMVLNRIAVRGADASGAAEVADDLPDRGATPPTPPEAPGTTGPQAS